MMQSLIKGNKEKLSLAELRKRQDAGRPAWYISVKYGKINTIPKSGACV